MKDELVICKQDERVSISLSALIKNKKKSILSYTRSIFLSDAGCGLRFG